MFRGEPEQHSGMIVNTDSAMKPNTFRPIPECRSASLRNQRSASPESLVREEDQPVIADVDQFGVDELRFGRIQQVEFGHKSMVTAFDSYASFDK